MQHTSYPTARAVLPFLLAATLSACVISGSFAPDPDGCEGPGTANDCREYPFLIVPEYAAVLKGDTVRVSTWSRPASANLNATWSSSPAGAFVTSEGLVKTIDTPISTVLLKAISRGGARIDAIQSGLGNKCSTLIYVADSSDITGIQVGIRIGVGTLTQAPVVVSLGSTERRDVFLMDDRRTYRGMPTKWSVTNTDVIEVRADSTGLSRFYFIPRAVGTSELHMQFLNVRASVTVQVVE